MKHAIKQVGLAVMTLCLAVATVEQAEAELITENTGGTGANTFFPGELLTTPAGGPWHDIMFNFFSDVPATTPTAAGTLFLLSREYLGTPADLSSSTPGFLAQSQSISGGMYLFDPSVTLQPDTQYFFYANASFLNSGGNVVPGGHVYFSFDPTSPFQASDVAANYRLSGTAIPEPTSLLLFGMGLLGFVGYTWRHLKLARA